MFIRKFRNSDAMETHEMIAYTLRTVNIQDYTPQFIEETIQQLSPEILIQRGETSHFYVFRFPARCRYCFLLRTDKSFLLLQYLLRKYLQIQTL